MGNAATPEITDMAAQGAQIDANFAVDKRIAWAFAPHEQSTPNMTVRLESGGLFNGSTVTERAAQNTGSITAPSFNPRIDRVVVDRASGDVSVVTGSESGSPTAPAVPEGKVPVAQVLLAVAAAAITNDMIIDERVLNAVGLGSIAFQNANNVSITGGTISNLSEPLAVADGGTGSTSLEGLIDALELGTMAFQDADNVDISGGSIADITDLAIADGGTGASNATDARTNLGLGSMATQSASSVSITGGSISGITDLTVADGGTGASSFTDGGVLIGNGSGAVQVTSAGTAGQVLTSNGTGSDPTFQAALGGSPVGAGAMWFTSSAPSGWLLCDGSAVSRTTYAALFAVISTTFGVGDGSTTFNLPNFSNRFPLGVGSHSLGNTGGAFSRNASDVPVQGHTHTFSGTTSSDGLHNHGNVVVFGSSTEVAGNDNTQITSGTSASAGAHTHTYSGTTGSGSAGSTLDITNPYLAIYYIIKT